MEAQPTDLFDGSRSGSLPGWRLHRLEMQNWGTFHQRVHRLSPEGAWSLLVGQNGSGKSTAIDALRTLLVPPRLLRRSYNDAAGESKAMDRTRYSYVRGAWRSQSSEVSHQGRLEYLRGEGEHSTLLAVFHHAVKQSWVTIAQILWLVSDKVDDLFLVAVGQRSIKEHLSQLGAGTAADWKKELKERRWEIKNEFSSYSARFRSLLGIPGEGALEVFNQAIGVKDVEDINSFVRRHMLEPSDARSFIQETLQPHYKELNDCHEAIRRAEDQIAELIPITESHERRQAALQQREVLQKNLDAVPLYFCVKHLELLEAETIRIANELKAVRDQKSVEKERIETLEERCRSLETDIRETDSGREIERLTNKIKELSRQWDRAQRNRQQWLKHLQVAGLPVAQDAADFAALHEQLAERQTTITSEKEVAEQELLQAKAKYGNHLEEEKRIEHELRIARERRVAIPAIYVETRDRLCEDTGIKVSELPFAGELMEVQSVHREWTGAIERVLHSFGVSLLVPERHCQLAVRWINGRHLGFRLVFHRVPERNLSLGSLGLSPDRVVARLNFRTNHPLHEWTQQEAARRFRHICCEDIGRLSNADAGVTREGLVKESGSRHVKDDRFRVDDPSKWVLGWSADRKIAALMSDLNLCRQSIQKAENAVHKASQRYKDLGIRLASLTALLLVEQFEEVDADGLQGQIEEVSADKQRLEQADEKVKEYKRQLDEATKDLTAARERSELLSQREGGLRTEQTANAKLADQRSIAMQSSPDFDARAFAKPLTDLLDGIELSLANIQDMTDRSNNKLRKQVGDQSTIINSAEREMLPKMAVFIQHFPEHRNLLKADMTYSTEFAELRWQLDKDDLPKHRQRFEKLMDENLVGGIAHFQTHLLESERSVKERIALVNTSLRRIPYTVGTHVQIRAAATANPEIGQFRSRVRSCLEGGLHPDADQRPMILERIRLLMEDFQKRDDWVKRVTDTRQWLEFSVRQLDDESLAEVDNFSGSGGRSGGQRAKLAFTILASAVVSQYGLADAPDPSECFRLVIIDEVFGRTDEEYSCQVLELFRNLGLQLVVVNPFDAKARLVEDWVESIHLAANPERKNSRLSRMSREEYEQLRCEHPQSESS